MPIEGLTPNQEKTLTETGALMRGHFILASGLRSEYYFQCALLCQYPEVMDTVCRELVARIPRVEEVQTVISPAIGGIAFGQELARSVGARAIFAEKVEGGAMALRRGFSLKPGEKVLLVEDVTTTGGSVRKVGELAHAAGAEILGYVTIVDRSGGAFQPDAPLTSWLQLHFPTFAAEETPERLRDTPAVKPGSGAGETGPRQ